MKRFFDGVSLLIFAIFKHIFIVLNLREGWLSYLKITEKFGENDAYLTLLGTFFFTLTTLCALDSALTFSLGVSCFWGEKSVQFRQKFELKKSRPSTIATFLIAIFLLVFALIFSKINLKNLFANTNAGRDAQVIFLSQDYLATMLIGLAMLFLTVFTLYLRKKKLSKMFRTAVMYPKYFLAIFCLLLCFSNFLNANGMPNSMNSTVKIFLGQKKINGIFISKGKLIEEHIPLDVTKKSQLINEVFTRFDPQNTNFFLALMPTKARVYQEDYDPFGLSPSEYSDISALNSAIGNAVIIDFQSVFSALKSEYIYCRTSDGLTEFGNFSAYKTIIKNLGKMPISLSNFNFLTQNRSYRGELYERSRLPVKPDFIQKYECKIAPKTNGSLLLIGDSYAENIRHFLMLHFDKVTFIPFQDFNGTYVADLSDYTQVLVILSV